MKSLAHHDYTVWHIWTCNLFVFFYTQYNWKFYRCNLRDLIRTTTWEIPIPTIWEIPIQIAGHDKLVPIILYSIVHSLSMLVVAVLWKLSHLNERINPCEGQNIMISQFSFHCQGLVKESEIIANWITFIALISCG